jgi:integrase
VSHLPHKGLTFEIGPAEPAGAVWDWVELADELGRLLPFTPKRDFPCSSDPSAVRRYVPKLSRKVRHAVRRLGPTAADRCSASGARFRGAETGRAGRLHSSAVLSRSWTWASRLGILFVSGQTAPARLEPPGAWQGKGCFPCASRLTDWFSGSGSFKPACLPSGPKFVARLTLAAHKAAKTSASFGHTLISVTRRTLWNAGLSRGVWTGDNMAEGIEIRHSRKCASRAGGQCTCKPTYQAQVYSRRERRVIKKTFATQAAAKRWRAEAQNQLNQGKLRAPTPKTLRQAGEALIAGMKDGSIRKKGGGLYKPSAIRSYSATLEKYAYPDLGALKLSTIEYSDLQDFVDRLAAQGLDGSTIRNIVMPLRVIYRRARREIPVNPTTDLEIVAPGNKQKRVVNAELAAALIDAVPIEDRALWATALYTGLRAGELQALLIEDVELYEQGRWGLIHVRRSWDKHEGYVEPKSAAGARTIPIPEQLYEILDEHRLRLDRTEGLIFGRTAETPFSYSGVRARAARVLEDAGFEPADFQMHEARHSYRTFLAAAGIPRDRRDRYLGHADGSVGSRYEHQLEHQYLDDARTLGEYLTRADTPARIEELDEIEIRDEVRDSRATVRDAP